MYVTKLIKQIGRIFAQEKGAMLPCGKEGLLCVRASVKRLGSALGTNKIPFLAFTVHSVYISRAHFTELRKPVTRAM
jgi:hypothetical protein